MPKDPDLFVFRTTPPTPLPDGSADMFKRWVLEDGIPASTALRRLMAQYAIKKLDASVPIDLLRYTYPDLDLTRNGFRFRIVDSGYPRSDPAQFSDVDFDAGLAEILAAPPGW